MIDKIKKYRDEMQGRIYKHFKGTRYIVLDVALHTETEEILVVYKNFDSPDILYARPISMFTGRVDREKYPDAKQEYRFEPLRCNDD